MAIRRTLLEIQKSGDLTVWLYANIERSVSKYQRRASKEMISRHHRNDIGSESMIFANEYGADIMLFNIVNQAFEAAGAIAVSTSRTRKLVSCDK